MSLNPRVTDLGSKVRLDWDADTTGQGYRFYIDGVGVSRTFKPDASSTTFSKPDSGTHRYGIRKMDVVGTLEQATFPAAPPPPPPDPDPVPSTFGDAIRTRFPWLEAYANATSTTTSLTPKSGTAGSPVVVDASDQNPASAIQWDGTYHDFVIRNLKHGGGSFDGIKVAGGASKFLVQLLRAYDLTGDKPQGFASQRGISQGAVLGALLERCGDNTLAHGLYWGLVTGDCLVAAVVAHSQHGYGLQFYPDLGAGTVYVTHVTLFGSIERNAMVVEDTKVEVHNSILGPNALAGINLRTGADVKVYRSCVPGANLSSSIYVDCIADDPDLDPVTFAPRNPKVLAFLGDPAWTPMHDCRGKAYTSPTIGAVAL